MSKNNTTTILIGVGVAAAAYYFYNKRKQQRSVPDLYEPVIPSQQTEVIDFTFDGTGSPAKLANTIQKAKHGKY